MNRSESIAELATALSKAQAAIPPVKKDLTATIETKAGGKYTYSYADLSACLEAIRKPLSDNGLAVIQTVETEPGSVSVETMLAHTSGQWVSHVIAFATANDPRSTGSSITYGRRYGLSLTGVVTEADDDGAAGHAGDRLPERKPQAAPNGATPTCPVCHGPMWDNRATKTKPTQPDFKCKNKECDGAIWPPKADAPPPEQESDAEFRKLTSATEERAAQTPNDKPKAGAMASLQLGGQIAQWNTWVVGFADIYPYYALLNGQPDLVHILRALASEGYAIVTPDNLHAACLALEARAKSKTAGK